MPGFIDSDTGLAFGSSLQWMTPIGGATLIIGPQGTTQEELTWGSFDSFLLWGAAQLVWGS